MSAAQTHQIRRLLVGEHAELYRTNSHFYTLINSFAEMLPAMVEGLAQQAIETNEKFTAMTEVLKKTPGPGLNTINISSKPQYFDGPFLDDWWHRVRPQPNVTC